MKLNKKVELGINAVNALKKYTTPVRTVDLCKEVGTTQNFLEQIMRNLRTAGIVVSVRGPGGGYKLNPATTTAVTAYDVARAVGKFTQGIDLGDTSATNKLRQAVLSAFENTTI